MAKHPAPPPPMLFDLPDAMPDDRLERLAMMDGHRVIAGCDEAGRGPLAGPVVAAAVILDLNKVPSGLNDSKQLSAAKREELFELILAHADCAIASASPEEIDRTDIRKASLSAMRRALAALPNPADHALFDGRDVPEGIGITGKAIIKGDARSLSIAAASILAKVTRDRMMRRAALDFPGYGFEDHAGYGTARHLDAIARLGPCLLHRMSFRPLRKD